MLALAASDERAMEPVEPEGQGVARWFGELPGLNECAQQQNGGVEVALHGKNRINVSLGLNFHFLD
jgi:hypothetical protein